MSSCEGGMGRLSDPDLGCKKTCHADSHKTLGTQRTP